MYLKKIVIVVTSVLSIPAFAQDFNAKDVQIHDFSYFGNGCPDGTTVYDVSSDGEAFTFIYNSFEVEAGGRGVDTKRCQLQFALKAPQGWSYALFSLQQSGYASLDAKTHGVQDTTFKLGNSGPIKLGKMRLDGPYDDDFIRTDDLSLHNLAWSRCDGLNRLVVNSMIRVKSRSNDGIGYMTIDSVDGEIRHSYGLLWKPCDSRVRANRNVLGVCKVEIRNARGQDRGNLLTQAYAKNDRQAIRKAERKINNRCQKRARRGKSCEMATLSCSSTLL